MQHQEPVALHLEHDPLADAPKTDHRCALDRRERRVVRLEKRERPDPHLRKHLSLHALAECVEVELDVWQFGHACEQYPRIVDRMAGPLDHEGREIDFGRHADDYDSHRPGFPPRFFDEVSQRGWVSDGGVALDLGTGTGSLALGWAERGLRVTGVDIAEELLAVTASRASARGLDVQVRVAPAEHTGLDADSFDLVSAGQCWWWFDSDAAASEVRRVLKPGGRIVICNFSYLALPGSVAARTEALVLDHNPGWPKAGWRGVHPEQVRALDEAGFDEVESFSFTCDVEFSHEAWRGRIRTCNGVGSALPVEQVEQFDTELQDLLGREFPEPLTVAHRVFAVSGVKV